MFVNKGLDVYNNICQGLFEYATREEDNFESMLWDRRSGVGTYRTVLTMYFRASQAVGIHQSHGRCDVFLLRPLSRV